MNAKPSNLCGAHAIYVTQGLLGDKSRSVDEILATFPDMKDNGISLKDVAGYLQRIGYCVHTKNLPEREMRKSGPDTVFVVFQKNETTPHLVVKWNESPSILKTMDFSQKKISVTESTSMPVSGKTQFALVVKKEKCSESLFEINPWFGVSILAVFFFIVLFLLSKRKKL